MATRIALYGGSFNPIHIGHLITARSVAEAIPLDRVIFLPSSNPPHKQDQALLDPAHRAQMVKLAIEGEPLFTFSDHDLTKTAPTYTVETVAHFAEALGRDTELHWIIGADSLLELTTWYRVKTLVDSCRIVTAARPGWDPSAMDELCAKLSDRQIEDIRAFVLQTPGIDISATDIRERIRAGLSIRFLVPDAVRAYIDAQKLYRDEEDEC